MKKLVIIFTLFLSVSFLQSQSKKSDYWLLIDNERKIDLTFRKTQSQEVEDLTFNAIWNEKLSYSANIGYYGGISELRIFKNNRLIETISKLEDSEGLGYISFHLYDYNFDGYLDFSTFLDCSKSCNYAYYLFNPQNEKFQHQKEWDYLKIHAINEDFKQILTVPDGNAKGSEQIIYEVDGEKLIKLKSLKR